MKLSGSEIRREFNLLNEAIQQMDEKFIKGGDPSMMILHFIESIDKSMSAIKYLYNQNAQDRNKIVNPVLDEVGEIEKTCAEFKSVLAVQDDGPEDVNKTIPVS